MMDPAARDQAVGLLHDAAVSRTPLAALPDGCKPRSAAEALAIQDLLVARSGKRVAGWKAATDQAGTAMYGTIYAEDCLPSPAMVDPARYPMMTIEGEIAFRFTEDLPAREAPYDRAELARVLAPFPAFEVVDTRFASYHDAPALDRLADRLSNGGMVLGEAVGTPPADLAAIPVTLSVDGEVVVDRIGGHVRGDPLLPALDLIRAEQARRSFARGQFITTGTFTGMIAGRPGQTFRLRFAGLGEVSLTVR